MTNDTDAYELTLFAENDGDLYRSRIQPIVTNLARKIVLRTYDADKALTLWRYAADDAAQRYTREHGTPGPHGSYGSFDTATRQTVATMLAESYADDLAEQARNLRLAKAWTVSAIKAAHGGTFFDRSHMKTNGETLKSFAVEVRHGVVNLIRTRDGKAWVFTPECGSIRSV
jgi:hypothetical protein